MEVRDFFRALARSPWGIVSLFAGLAVFGLGLALDYGVLIVLPASLISFGLLIGLGFATGLAPRSVSAEADRAVEGRAASRLAQASEARSRLAALRLADESVAKSRDLLVLEAGRFVEDCSRKKTYDPEGVQAIIDSLGIVDSWLKEADASATEKRYGLPDADPFPEAAARVSFALRAKAALVAARRASALGEPPPSDRLAIEEELR